MLDFSANHEKNSHFGGTAGGLPSPGRFFSSIVNNFSLSVNEIWLNMHIFAETR